MNPLMLFAESSAGNRDSCETTEYPAIEERLSIAEKYLGVRKPVPKSVYERLKNVEDRLLHLESISPEYKDFWVRALKVVLVIHTIQATIYIKFHNSIIQ